MPDEPDNDILLNHITFDHAIAIAEVVSTWAGLEYSIDGSSWALAGLEQEEGACLTAQFSTVHARMNALIALSRVKGADEFHIAKLNKLREWIAALGEKRNRVVHDPWYYGMNSETMYRLQKTARGKLDFDYKPISKQEMDTLIGDIKKATADLGDVSGAILRAFWSSR